MPNPRYPRNIYLQSNLRLTEKRTVRDDARINDRGNGISPGPTQRPNNSIPLKEWIQEQIDNDEIDIPCTCENTCNLIATNDYVQFRYNTLAYQFHPILGNDFIGTNLSNIDVEIVDDSTLSDSISVSLFESQFYPFKIIKITRPTAEVDIGNLDQVETFTYKLTGICDGEEIESNIATVNILPVSINIEQYINNNP